MYCSLITPPTIEPIALAEAKLHSRVDYSVDDSWIYSAITGVRAVTEGICGNAILTQTWDGYLDNWPSSDYIVIDRPPLQSITSITYTDSDESSSTMSATTEYYSDIIRYPGRAVLRYGQTWPSATLSPRNPIAIRFVAGYTAYSGTVNTSGTTITKATGSSFNTAWIKGKTIVINGVLYSVSSVTDASTLVVTSTAGNQTGVAYQTNDVPEDLRSAMLLLFGHLYEHREEVVMGDRASLITRAVDFGYPQLISRYRYNRFGGERNV